MRARYLNCVGFQITLGLLCYQELCQDPIFVFGESKVFVSDLVIVRELSKLLYLVLLLDRLKVDVISYPHIFQCLQKESLF
jgi:hypothetical protein